MNPSEALICAKASEAIYGTQQDPAGQKTTSDALEADGFSNYTWIDLTGIFEDVCAFVASSPSCNLLAFRGTKVPQDWMEDLACAPVRFDWIFSGAPAIGEIHSGFGHTLAEGLPRILAALTALPCMQPGNTPKPLLITGHSLGGALAALVGAHFKVTGASVPPIQAIYTFGQPRIGLHDFCNTYDRVLNGKLVRFVNKKDLVPRVPFRNWDYGDEGTMIHFDNTGTPSIQASQWQNFLARTLESLGDFFEIVKDIRFDVGDHSMTGYRTLVESNSVALIPLLQQA